MALLSGFFLGLGLIVAIGAQNAFILRQGIYGHPIFLLCLIASISDALLIILGVAGFGTFIRANEFLLLLITGLGVLFLCVYGLISLRRFVFWSETIDLTSQSTKPAVLTLLAFTFLNPHVYLDTVILVGGFSAQYESYSRFLFGLGACVASFVWFFGLGYGSRILSGLFAHPLSWRFLELVISLIMLTLSYFLLLEFLTLLPLAVW